MPGPVAARAARRAGCVRARRDLRQAQLDAARGRLGARRLEVRGHALRVVVGKRLLVDEAAHRQVLRRQRRFGEIVAQVLHVDLAHAVLVRQPHHRGQLVQVAPHHHHHPAHLRPRAGCARLGPHQPLQVAHHLGEAGANADVLVGGGAGAVDRDVDVRQPAVDAARRARLGQQRQVGVGRHPHAALGGQRHHVEELRMQHRLAQPLQLQLGHAGELVEQAGEQPEVDMRGPVARRAFRAQPHRAHAAAQVALADRLDLQESRRRRGRARRAGRAGCARRRAAALRSGAAL